MTKNILQYKSQRYSTIVVVIIFVIAIIFSGCSPTKYLKSDEKLLLKNSVEIEYQDKTDAGFKSSDLEPLIRPRPNATLLGYMLYARLYNLASAEKAEHSAKKKNKKCNAKKLKRISKIQNKILKYEKRRNDFETTSDGYKKYTEKIREKEDLKFSIKQEICKHKHWTRNIGNAPVIYNTNDRRRTIRQMKVFLKNKGYYNAKVTDSVNFDDFRKVKRKRIFRKNYVSPYAKVIYIIAPGKPFRIGKITYKAADSIMQQFLEADKNNSLIKTNLRLDTELFQNEKARIENKLRSQGYYKFSKEYIRYTVDTLNTKKIAAITVTLNNPADKNGLAKQHKKYKLNKVLIYTDFDPKQALINREKYFSEQDSTFYFYQNKHPFYFLKKDRQTLSYKSVARGTYLYQDSLFNFQNVKDSYRYLSSLKVIKIANINFKDTPIQPDSANYGWLDCELRLTPGEIQAFQAELTGTNTSGNIGAATNLIYQHRNLFNNGEVFDMNMKLALERQTNRDKKINLIKEAQDFFNSSEVGMEMSIKFPRLLSPIKLRSFNKRVTPNTEISLIFNSLKRPDYARTIAGTSFGYNWNSSPTIRHYLQPLTFDLINLKDPSEEFLKYIKRYRLEESYEDHLIWGIAYTLTINNQLKKKKKNPSYIRINLKNAGIGLNSAMQIVNAKKVDGTYHLFATPFSQFFKTDIDYRYFQQLDRFKDKLVFRTFAGAILPYGNSKSVPFGEKYFSGGANGLRAWQVRTVGPGAYQYQLLTSDSLDVFPNQTADIKLEANIEYRFKLFWTIEGALFVDAGNIWAINNNDERNKSQFYIDDFYKQIAVGTGFGFRLDFDFFIIRTDFGIKLREPYKTKDKYWIPGNRSFGKDDWTFNVGIGYPF